jgi:hypothetical protein
MRFPACSACCVILLVACGARSSRGIADRRSSFREFLPMKSDASRDGLREVKPYFTAADPSRIEAAIKRACTQGREGSSVFDQRSGRGYYVNCNPHNLQLLNGYVPSNPKEQPHSR